MFKYIRIICLTTVICLCLLSVGFTEEQAKSEKSGGDIDEIFSEGFDDEAESDMDDIFQDGFDGEEKADSDLDELFDEGFDEEEQTGTEIQKKLKGSKIVKFLSFLNLSGSSKLSAVYNFAHKEPESEDEIDWQGVSSLRGDFQLAINPKLFKSWEACFSVKGFGDLVYEELFDIHVWEIRTFANYGPPKTGYEILEHYRDEIEVGEAYVSGNLIKNLDLKVGRQIVVWGKADALRITDILNPADLRFPGVTAGIEEARLPVFMTRLDYYFGQWNVSGIIVHENRFSKYPVYGSDFYPYGRPFSEDVPTDFEYGFAINGVIKESDISFYLADFYDDTPAINLFPAKIKHTRNTMVGAAFGIAIKKWLFKAETAYVGNIEYISTPEKIYNRADLMIGIEYYGFRNMTLISEVMNKHISNYDEQLKEGLIQVDADDFTAVFGLSRIFMDELLTLNLGIIVYGLSAQNGSSETITVDYSLTDSIKAGCGILLFQAGDLENVRDIGDNDRVYFNVKYRF